MLALLVQLAVAEPPKKPAPVQSQPSPAVPLACLAAGLGLSLVAARSQR